MGRPARRQPSPEGLGINDEDPERRRRGTPFSPNKCSGSYVRGEVSRRIALHGAAPTALEITMILDTQPFLAGADV